MFVGPYFSGGDLITSGIVILVRHETDRRAAEVQTDFPILWARQSRTAFLPGDHRADEEALVNTQPRERRGGGGGGGGLILACVVALLEPRFALLPPSLHSQSAQENRDQISDIQFPDCHGTKKLKLGCCCQTLVLVLENTRHLLQSVRRSAQTAKLPSRRRGQNTNEPPLYKMLLLLSPLGFVFLGLLENYQVAAISICRIDAV